LKKKIKYLNFIGLLLLAVILWKIDFNEVMQYLKNVNYWYLLLAYPFLMLNISLKSVRWNFLMRSQGVQLPLSKTLYVYLWGYYFGTVTPGRIGEISKAIYFQDKFENLGRAFVSVVVDRLYDIGIRVALLFILYPLYSNLFEFRFIGFLIMLVMVGAGGIVLIRMKSIRNIVSKMSEFVIPKKFYSVIKSNISGFINDMVNMITSVKVVSVTSMITFVSYLFYFIMAYSIQKSFNIEMDFTYNIFCVVLTSLAAVVPISISGLGVREAVMIYLFSNIGLGKEAAVLFSLSFFALNPILAIHGWIVNTFMMFGGAADKENKLGKNSDIPEKTE